jgi:signal transduction histidine kinase
VVSRVDADVAARLGEEDQRLVYRVAHECLLNCMRHAGAARVAVTLTSADDTVLLEVADDGVGFDPAAVLGRPAEGHFGLRVLADVARDGGADLRVASAPGRGTRWQLRVRSGA